MTRRARVIYAQVLPASRHAFVKHPVLRGLWIKTHPCVGLVACSYCGAEVDEPCRAGRGGWISGTHVARRTAAKKKVRSK